MSLHRFDGETYSPKRDSRRLTKQYERVRDLMLDGEWRSLDEIGGALKIPEASASARLRDLRKPRFGGFVVDRKHLEGGLFKYRLRVPRALVMASAEPAPVATPEPTEARLFDPTEVRTPPLKHYEDRAA